MRVLENVSGRCGGPAAGVGEAVRPVSHVLGLSAHVPASALSLEMIISVALGSVGLSPSFLVSFFAPSQMAGRETQD